MRSCSKLAEPLKIDRVSFPVSKHMHTEEVFSRLSLSSFRATNGASLGWRIRFATEPLGVLCSDLVVILENNPGESSSSVISGGLLTGLLLATYTRQPVTNGPSHQGQRVEALRPLGSNRLVREVLTLALSQRVLGGGSRQLSRS